VLHPKGRSPVGPLIELLSARQKVLVIHQIDRNLELIWPAREPIPDAPLPRLNADQTRRAKLSYGTVHLSVEALGIAGIIYGHVVDGVPSRHEVDREMPHRGEKKHGPLPMAGDVSGLLFDLHHQHCVLSGIETAEPRRVVIELVAEQDQQLRDLPTNP
jgi:hypothetical protein